MKYIDSIMVKPGHRTGVSACPSNCDNTERVEDPQRIHHECNYAESCTDCHRLVVYERNYPGMPRLPYEEH